MAAAAPVSSTALPAAWGRPRAQQRHVFRGGHALLMPTRPTSAAEAPACPCKGLARRPAAPSSAAAVCCRRRLPPTGGHLGPLRGGRGAGSGAGGEAQAGRGAAAAGRGRPAGARRRCSPLVEQRGFVFSGAGRGSRRRQASFPCIGRYMYARTRSHCVLQPRFGIHGAHACRPPPARPPPPPNFTILVGP